MERMCAQPSPQLWHFCNVIRGAPDPRFWDPVEFGSMLGQDPVGSGTLQYSEIADPAASRSVPNPQISPDIWPDLAQPDKAVV